MPGVKDFSPVSWTIAGSIPGKFSIHEEGSVMQAVEEQIHQAATKLSQVGGSVCMSFGTKAWGICPSPAAKGSHSWGGMVKILFSAPFSLPIHVHNSVYGSFCGFFPPLQLDSGAHSFVQNCHDFIWHLRS